jgi:hypothetical protein
VTLLVVFIVELPYHVILECSYIAYDVVTNLASANRTTRLTYPITSYIIYLVVVRFYRIPFILIAILDLFGDGTTYTQLAFLCFTFWVVIAAIWIRPFFRQPKTVAVVL